MLFNLKTFTKILTYFIRTVAFLLIGVNFFRVFGELEKFSYIQNPPILALFNSFVLLLYSYTRRIFKRFNLEISDLLYALISISIILTYLLGMLFSFYVIIPGYDSFAHFLNGGLLVLVGVMVLSIFVKKDVFDQLSPAFIVLFAFSFAALIGVFWEIIEFSSDIVLGSNMQRFADLETGIDFVGQEALLDTMKDIILNTIGGLIISIILYFDLKRDFPYIKKMNVKRINTDNKINKN